MLIKDINSLVGLNSVKMAVPKSLTRCITIKSTNIHPVPAAGFFSR